MSVSSPMKWHGGKAPLAGRIIEAMPSRCQNTNAPDPDDRGWLHYVEPYAGGLSVLLANDPEGISEVVNDINGELANFWDILRCEVQFPRFLRMAQATEFSERVFDDAANILNLDSGCDDDARKAWAFFVRCRLSLAGRMKSFTGITKTRTRRGMNNEVSAWLSAIEGLPDVHARLKRVLILNRDALEVIRSQDGPRTLFYLDPPYLDTTRTAPDVYAHEMSGEDHVRLLDVLGGLRGRFILSGYRSDLYDAVSEKHGWRRVDIEVANHAAGGAVKRRMTECLWMNYPEEDNQ